MIYIIEVDSQSLITFLPMIAIQRKRCIIWPIMERLPVPVIEVPNPPGGETPYSIRIENADYLRRHPSFQNTYGILAVIRNQDGFVIQAVNVGDDLLQAEEAGGRERRIARIDVCDLMGITQDIVDN